MRNRLSPQRDVWVQRAEERDTVRRPDKVSYSQEPGDAVSLRGPWWVLGSAGVRVTL